VLDPAHTDSQQRRTHQRCQARSVSAYQSAATLQSDTQFLLTGILIFRPWAPGSARVIVTFQRKQCFVSDLEQSQRKLRLAGHLCPQ
jgi:hypothetical protein